MLCIGELARVKGWLGLNTGFWPHSRSNCVCIFDDVTTGIKAHRHTCVSTLISLNVNIKAIQGWVGHASITETMDTYGHLFTDANLEIRAKFDEHARASRTSPKLRVVN